MSESDLPPTSRSGDARVDAVLDRFEGLDERPVAEHVEVFESVLSDLRSALSDAGAPPAPTA